MIVSCCGGLGGDVRRTVVGEDDLRVLDRRVGQCSEMFQVLARRVGHRHHGQLRTHADNPSPRARIVLIDAAPARRRGRRATGAAASDRQLPTRGETTRSRPVAVPDARVGTGARPDPFGVRAHPGEHRARQVEPRGATGVGGVHRRPGPATDTRQFEQAAARSTAYVGEPTWSSTTETVSFSFSSRSIVATKSVPLPVYTHAVRTMCASGSTARIASSPASLVRPYAVRGPVGSRARTVRRRRLRGPRRTRSRWRRGSGRRPPSSRPTRDSGRRSR